MEMRQCEYRAVIPSALACGTSSSFSGSALGPIVGAVVWTMTTAVYLLAMAAAALVVSALTGYGSRFAHSLPEVQARMLCAPSVLMFCQPLLSLYSKLSRKKFMGGRKQGDGI
jgi:hypothetical protein